MPNLFLSKENLSNRSITFAITYSGSLSCAKASRGLEREAYKHARNLFRSARRKFASDSDILCGLVNYPLLHRSFDAVIQTFAVEDVIENRRRVPGLGDQVGAADLRGAGGRGELVVGRVELFEDLVRPEAGVGRLEHHGDVATRGARRPAAQR
jgi:hypothetical protein